MDNNKTNKFYILKALEHLKNINEFLLNVDEDEFYKSKILKSAVCFEFVQVYENSKKISDDILLTDKEFPLIELRGFRNRLVHEYGVVDYSIIFNTVKKDVPLLIEQLSNQIKSK